MRAVRFSVELDFEIEMNTRRAIDEACRWPGGDCQGARARRARKNFNDAERGERDHSSWKSSDLLRLRPAGTAQRMASGRTNIISIRSLNIASVRSITQPRENYSLVVRMAALLHDIGKPKVKGGDGLRLHVLSARVYRRAHDGEGARSPAVFKRICGAGGASRTNAHVLLRHRRDLARGGAATRRACRPENIDDLLKVREADRIGSGVESGAVPPAPSALYDREGEARPAFAEDARAAR